MRQHSPVTGTANRAIDDRENWMTGGLLVTVLGVPALLAFMAVPGVVLGAALGAAALELARRGAGKPERNCAVDRSTESSGTQRAAWTSAAD